jgi:glycosyltransferase involved in cell wall biosynthesis
VKALAISHGFARAKIRRQPWCYVHKVWRYLPEHGIHGVIVSDGYPRLAAYEEIDGVGVHHVRSVRCFPDLKNRPLQSILRSRQPDVVLWDVGTTSLLHLGTGGLTRAPLVALFTSPTYRLSDVIRVGPRLMATEFRHLYVHLLAAATPRFLIRQALARVGFSAIIALTQEAKEGLIGCGVPRDQIHVVAPGVDDEWLDPSISHDDIVELRQKAGLEDGTFLVLYLGDPSLPRGPDVLLRAVAQARVHSPHIRVLLLCRRSPGEYAADERRLRRLASNLQQNNAVHFVSGYLPAEEVRHWVSAADLVALPFLVVPSEGPISILEAAAVGKPIVATAVDGIPSLLPSDAVRLVPPGDAEALARAILEVATRDRVGARQQRHWRRCWRDVAADVAAILHEVARNE